MSWLRFRLAALARWLAGDASSGGSGDRTSIRTKLLLMMLPAALLGLGTSTYFASQSGKRALTEGAFKQLTGYRAAKKQQIERYFRGTRDTFSVLGHAPGIVAAFKAFKDGHGRLANTPLPEAERVKLEKYYSSEILPLLADATGSTPRLGQLWPDQNSALQLQALFITANPYGKGERIKLDTHPVENPYTLAHARHHPWLRDLVEKLDYHDLMMSDEQGTLIYGAAKEIDLGTNLVSGPHADTNAGRLVRSIIKEQGEGRVRLADYAYYAPSFNSPQAFMGVPIFDGRTFLGVLVAQISSKPVDDFMNNHHSWREQGLGDSGSAYIASIDDRLMRSSSREIVEKPDEYLQKLAGATFLTPAAYHGMKRDRTTILYYPVNPEPLVEAAKGKEGTTVIASRKGGNVLISYAPLDISDVNWAVLVRMDENEVLASQIEFNRSVLGVGCLLVLLTTIAALWMARSFMRPIDALVEGIERIRKGERDVVIGTHSRDELGDLTEAFNAMSADIRARDEVIEGKNKAYAQLLKRIFPEAVADRLRQGEADIAQTFKEATVVYAIVDGLARLPDAEGEADPARILNDVVDAFDAAADRAGVEKVKTIGDHYLAVAGLDSRLDHGKRALEFAHEMRLALEGINAARAIALKLRVGIATGPVRAGLVGNRRFVYDIWGQAASVARRIVYDADPDTGRMSAETLATLIERPDVSGEIEVHTKSWGGIRTFQFDLGAAGEPGAHRDRRRSRAAE